MDKELIAYRSRYQDDEFYLPLLKDFVRDLQGEYQILTETLASREMSMALNHCHQLSGSAATYGYPELSKVFEGFERELSTDCLSDEVIEEHMSEIKRMLTKIRMALLDSSPNANPNPNPNPNPKKGDGLL